jgi:hypothetical protein
MAKISSKIRAQNHKYYQKVISQPSNEAPRTRTQAVPPMYNANQYIKRDLSWSALTAALVVLVMIILFIVLK